MAEIQKSQVEKERKKETLQHEFLLQHVKYIQKTHRRVCIENPESSALWTESRLADVNLFTHRFAQCAHSDLKDGHRVQKKTIIKANFALKNNVKPCQCLLGHDVLEGLQTSKAAAFPYLLCKNLVKDMLTVTDDGSCILPPHYDILPVRTMEKVLADAEHDLRPGSIRTDICNALFVKIGILLRRLCDITS